MLGDERVEAIEVVRNRLDADDSGAVRAVPPTSGRRSRAASSSAASATAASPSPRCRSTSGGARSGTTAAASSTTTARRFPGVYCAGWIKRGPSGVIGTNKKDATETVELLFEDVRDGRLAPKGATAAAVDALLEERGITVVMHEGWCAIDEAERSAGEKLGRPRVKLCSWDELLRAAGQAAAAPTP